ncbi:alkaline phosphatase family protein [Taibaiella lutea]|uniref:glycerophosphocholine cholinephosphodiesterase n=1 Tax=Taibaiella lutea TaxID=2608001 RepID=A0A5M6CEN0_9BACT|nr:alkaline phosphatase PafA [Taibaiella lutea]KAA5533571.1 alkaline phosphatase family protein [Taibaiella lutea]
MNLKQLLSLCCCILFINQAKAQPSTPARPKLVVGIVIDQMRWDYLYRFYDKYGNDGFKRMMNEGFNCQNTMIPYLPTFTGPGHTCIYTGSVPAFHGIVANEWIDNRTGKEWYCAEDTTVISVGGGKAGLMSPRNMLATTITDELRLATNFQSKTIGIALKDRGSILPAGHSANAAYWFDDESGSFITSSFYENSLPQWLQQFNARKVTDSLLKQNWNTLYDIHTYTESTADNSAYEGVTRGEQAPVFQHITAGATYAGAVRATPMGNTLTRMMAQACIDGEQMGRHKNCDFLAVSFSSTDYIGHQYGPNSIEIEDTYLRLDKELATFFAYLDKTVGKGAYTVFLSADHGAAHNPAFLNDNRIPAKAIPLEGAVEKLNQFLQSRYGNSGIVKSLMNYQVYLNDNIINTSKLDRQTIKEDIMNWFKVQDGVTAVLDLENTGGNVTPEPLQSMVTNGYYANRCGVIQIILNPGWYSGHGSGDNSTVTGTTHGSWNPYDAHIPLLWYGWGIPKGETFKTTYMTDIAATLAALLHIQVPNACIGKVIEEIKK